MRTSLAQDVRLCISPERPVRPASGLAGDRTACLHEDPIPVRGRMPPTLPPCPGIDVRITRAQVPSLMRRLESRRQNDRDAGCCATVAGRLVRTVQSGAVAADRR